MKSYTNKNLDDIYNDNDLNTSLDENYKPNANKYTSSNNNININSRDIFNKLKTYEHSTND